MLCRALLTAVAISCTFPLAHVQGTQRKIHRKDLICVLWLSGLQKEDLDVNMLRKLQRHNVNIDDKDADDLKRDCLNIDTRKGNIKGEEENITDEETTTTFSAFETETEINTKYDESVINSDLSTILGNIIDKQKQKDQEKYSVVIGENLETVPSRLENISVNENLNSTTELQIDEKRVDMNKTKLENVINFWKNFANPITKNDNIEVTKRTKMIKKKTKNKTVKKTISNDEEGSSKEAEHLHKLLAKYFSKSTNSPTTQTSIISPADLSNLSKLTKQFENFFKLMSQSKIIPNNYEKNVSNNLTENNDPVKDSNIFNNNNNIPQQTFLMRASKKQYVDSNSKKHSISDISGLLLLNDQIKKSFTPPNYTYSSSFLMPIIGQSNNNQQFYGTPESAFPTANQQITIVKDKIGPHEINVFPKDVIEKIAENVKEKVLKDLRQEITLTTSLSITSSMTSTTAASLMNTIKPTETDLIITEKPFENKTEDANLILKTITELFKEFKAFKQMSVSTTTTQSTGKFDTVKVNSLPVQMVNTRIIQKHPETENSYKSAVPQNIAEMHTMAHKKNIRLNIPPVNTIRQSTIIQTNSGEIPPLGVPVSNPLQFIHQNIVVTTARPSAKTTQSKEPWAINIDRSNNRVDMKNRYERYRYSNHSQHRPLPSNVQKYNSRISHAESNRSQYNRNSFHRDNDRLHYNSDESHHYTDHLRYNSNPSHGDSHRLRYDSDHLILNPITSKYDLKFSNYNTDTPMFKQPISNERYNIRNEMARYIDRKDDDRLRIINRAKDYHLDIQPKPDFFENNNHDFNQYKNTSSGIHRQPDIKGFHERLERVDSWQGDDTKVNKQDTSKCCEDLALASRQQLALNTMKTNYDDTHFKDFLKTQQRVNDMLEKILSSKTSEPRSVEII